MKSSFKFALSILAGTSVLALSACDNQDAKTTEKSTALLVPAPKVMSDNAEIEMKKLEEVASTKAESGTKTNTKIDVVNEKTEAAKEEMKKTESVKVEAPAQVVSPKAVKQVKIVKEKAESHYLREQKAMLKVLESQYKQVRCGAEAAKLGEDSFCRQEERRLLLEIQRVKNEIRANQSL